MDSGDYPAVAEQVINCWEERCRQLQEEGRETLPRPILMNSNISSIGDVEEVGPYLPAAF